MEGEILQDPIDFLRNLYIQEIRYLLVGRQALILLGAPLLSADYDFYLSPDRDELDVLLAFARQKKLEVSVKDPEDKQFFSLLSDNLKLDFFRCRSYSIEGGETFTFDELYERKRVIPIDDFAVYVPTIRDLMKTKRIRNLPRDREDLKYLQVLLEREGG